MEASVADLASRREEEPDDKAQPIIGDGEQLTLNVGGAKVSASEFKLQGGSLPLEGQFNKGQMVELVITARIGKVEFEDKIDSTGTVIGTTRRHVGKIESCRRSDS